MLEKRQEIGPCFRYTAGTRVFTVVASSDFTSRSSDYLLSKAGLFSTKYHCLNSAVLQ